MKVLKPKLDLALMKCFPISDCKFSHIENAILHKHRSETCDYYSHTPQLLWDSLTQQLSHKKRAEQGLWGLPDALEVGRDIMVQMMDPGDIIQTMDCA